MCKVLIMCTILRHTHHDSAVSTPGHKDCYFYVDLFSVEHSFCLSLTKCVKHFSVICIHEGIGLLNQRRFFYWPRLPCLAWVQTTFLKGPHTCSPKPQWSFSCLTHCISFYLLGGSICRCNRGGLAFNEALTVL